MQNRHSMSLEIHFHTLHCTPVLTLNVRAAAASAGLAEPWQAGEVPQSPEPQRRGENPPAATPHPWPCCHIKAVRRFTPSWLHLLPRVPLGPSQPPPLAAAAPPGPGTARIRAWCCTVRLQRAAGASTEHAELCKPPGSWLRVSLTLVSGPGSGTSPCSGTLPNPHAGDGQLGHKLAAPVAHKTLSSRRQQQGGFVTCKQLTAAPHSLW